jgi:predicted acyltransferase
LQLPINKKIWTPSYVLLTTGLAMAALALCLRRLEPLACGAPGLAPPLPLWARFFEPFGKNPLFVFVLSGLVPRVLGLLRWQNGVDAQGAPLWTSPLPWAYDHLFAGVGHDPRLGSFLYALANLLLYAALAAWLDRRRIYIRV